MHYSGKVKIHITYLLLLLASCAMAQQDSIKKPAPLQGFNISGNYRFYAQHRYFTEPYAISRANDEIIYLNNRSILIGDATQLPELTLNISGNPTPKTSFGTDLIVWNQNTGGFDYYRNVQLGINLYGSFSTPFANVNIRAGGLHWHSMTPFTMRSFSGYNRYSVFDRNPWDPQFREIDRRYADYYKNGAISQDVRWSQQAVQGLIMDLTELPLGLAVNVLYGKTQNSGSAFTELAAQSNDSTYNAFLAPFQNTVPNNAFGGRLIKSFNGHQISLNTFNRLTYSDAQAKHRIENHIYTAEFAFKFEKLSVRGEAGLGHYSDVYKDYGVGELASVKISLHESVMKVPIELHAYRISSNVVNNNGEFVNTSVVEAMSAAQGITTTIGANGFLQQTGSAMLSIGQMANNRQGVNLNADFKIDDLSISVGTGMAKEIENINSQITYGHTINGLTMSRFWRWSFPSNVGPYGRTSVLYRGVFETVNLTDLSIHGGVENDKYFNNLETQIKYKFNLGKNPWYIFYLGSFNSVQTRFSPVTVFTEDAYIRQYSHQLENYYRIHAKWVIALYGGWERVIGNYDTQVDISTKRPRNQEGVALGLGFDYMMAKNTGLYLRHRYFKFEDKSYALDRFTGHETTLELKIYF
jgi:hypothetical protein